MSLDEREFYGPLPDQAEQMMRAYMYRWRKQHDNWEVLYCEERFVVQDEDGNNFSFKPDIIVREKDTGLIVCWDHKSTTNIPDADWRLEDLQSTLYMWALPKVGIEVDLFGFNYMNTNPYKLPKTNQDGRLSTRKVTFEFYSLAEYLTEFYGGKSKIPKYWKIELREAQKNSTHWFKRSRIVKDPALINRQIEELDWTTMEMLSFIEFISENPDIDPWVRSLDRSCEWSCDFHDLCQADLLGADTTFMIKSQFRKSRYQEELMNIGGQSKKANPRSTKTPPRK